MAAPGPVSTGLFVTAYLLGSWFTWKEVVVALRARRFEIDFLMLLAAAGAAVLGDWVEGALLLFLFSLGHALEGFAMGRARNAIAALARLAPSTALRVDPHGQRDRGARLGSSGRRPRPRQAEHPDSRGRVRGAGNEQRQPGADHR